MQAQERKQSTISLIGNWCLVGACLLAVPLGIILGGTPTEPSFTRTAASAQHQQCQCHNDQEVVSK